MSRLPSPDTASRCVHCFPVPEATLPVPQGTFWGLGNKRHRLVCPPAWVALSAPAWQCCATCTQRLAYPALRPGPQSRAIRSPSFTPPDRIWGSAAAGRRGNSFCHTAHMARPAGLTRCKASSQTTRVISAVELHSHGGGSRRRTRMPVQRHLTFAFAALDRQFEALHRACEDESLLQLDGDAQIVFLA